ncbi:leukocyte immunoglobulin-like receptor subfamily A member 4 isoform X3 [Scyliorhinus torazame]|uniref:leukocyte immunoglobulin-like receptor subfamily A member 4 isoform X3 n=1 Tax=Scyliorhinus torazame TaxID=75743 RepID=UPI003B5C9FC7
MIPQFATSMAEILPAVILLSLGLLLNIGEAQDRLAKPTISFEPVSGIALEGGIVIIKCAVDINVPKWIYIFRGQEMVFNGTQDSNETAVFTIVNVTSTNRGIYRCIYDLLVPNQRRSSSSNVIRLTVLGTNAPLSILHPAAVEVNVGGKLNMSCSTASNGRCLYYQDSKFQLAEGRNNVTVSIINLSFCDEGNYTCYCLVEVNNSTVFSARSNIMQVTVSGKLTDRPEAKNKFATEGTVLILTSAILGVTLPKRKIAMSQTHIRDETELQDISD